MRPWTGLSKLSTETSTPCYSSLWSGRSSPHGSPFDSSPTVEGVFSIEATSGGAVPSGAAVPGKPEELLSRKSSTENVGATTHFPSDRDVVLLNLHAQSVERCSELCRRGSLGLPCYQDVVKVNLHAQSLRRCGKLCSLGSLGLAVKR